MPSKKVKYIPFVIEQTKENKWDPKKVDEIKNNLQSENKKSITILVKEEPINYTNDNYKMILKLRKNKNDLLIRIKSVEDTINSRQRYLSKYPKMYLNSSYRNSKMDIYRIIHPNPNTLNWYGLRTKSQVNRNWMTVICLQRKTNNRFSSEKS